MKYFALCASLVLFAVAAGCTVKVETCPDNQNCAPVVNVNAEFCGNIIVGGQVVPVKCPADAGDGGDAG